MRRSQLAAIAQDTLAALERGDHADLVATCLAGTRLYPPAELVAVRDAVLAAPSPNLSPRIDVANETTLAGLAHLLAESPDPVAVLNFASAKNPGGGFLNGSQAQEESLARSSGLYASLTRCPGFYAAHRASPSLLYSDAVIWSPDCPVVRGDSGDWLDPVRLASFVTCAAPNAGAIADNRPDEAPHIPETFRRRAELVLAVVASHGVRRLVLGAWGCGVFRNDPAVVAAAFASHLVNGVWAGRFERVRFAVLDTSATGATIAAFARAFGGGA